MIETWLTRRFGLGLPVVGAPMAGPGDGRLAAAVAAAGGLGMIGAGNAHPPAWIREQARVAAAAEGTWGIGLMAWALEQDATPLDTVLDLRPGLVSISFGAFEPHVRRVREAGIPVTTQVGTLDEALRAEQVGVDFLVARGGEGGGHGRNEVATLPLLASVLDRVDVPVVAAGGIGTARGLAAVLACGAAGAWVGTGLLTADEAATSPAVRRRLLAAGQGDTGYGRVFDVALGLDWPPEYGGRALRNDFFELWKHRLDALADDAGAAEELARELCRAGQDPDDDDPYDTAYIYAGQGVGTLTRERPAAEVLADLGGAERLLAADG